MSIKQDVNLNFAERVKNIRVALEE